MKRRKSNQDRRRKEEKKLERMRLEEANDRNKWIITILVVILIFVGFYFLSIYVTNKNKEKKTNTKDMTGEIILGKSFSMSSQDYYVLYYDSTDKIVAGTCKDLFSSYHSAHGEGSIYYVDINKDGTKDKITKTFIETGNAHAYYEYKIELKSGDKYVDITPQNFRTTNGASCDLQQIKFSFKPKFKVTIISRGMGDLWNTPTMAYKQTFTLSSDNKMRASQKTQMRSICDVKELF